MLGTLFGSPSARGGPSAAAPGQRRAADVASRQRRPCLAQPVQRHGGARAVGGQEVQGFGRLARCEVRADLRRSRQEWGQGLRWGLSL